MECQIYCCFTLIWFYIITFRLLLFTFNKRDEGFITLLVYVDDIIVSASSNQLAIDVGNYLSSHFKLKDLGVVKYFLGFEVAPSS